MADTDDPGVTPREPVAARTVLRVADEQMLARHNRASVAAERGCVYCGGDTLATQVRRLRWIGVCIVALVTLNGLLLLVTLLM